MGLYEFEWDGWFGKARVCTDSEAADGGRTFPGIGGSSSRLPDGGLEAKSMERLRAEEAWGTFAEWVCS